MPASVQNSSRAGIITGDRGERHIPASTRSDGSTRREIKIRPGYRPPEDVEVYKNRAADAWKKRGSAGVPGAATVDDDDDSVERGGASKNAKRREARKRAKAADGKEADRPERGPDQGPEQVEARPDAGEATAEAEREKQAKKLQKKLRQARDLKQKEESGESLLPEQLEKVIKINELIRQLDQLGFGVDGEPKPAEP